jgi:glycosyltransferase involved in cell wall biosynthesis
MSKTSVIISSYNQRQTLELSLEALSKQSVLPIEVIVSDDGSTDGTIEWLDALPGSRFPFPLSYVTTKHDGYNVAGVYNAGLGRLKGIRLLISNADVLLSPDSVKLHEDLPDFNLGGGFIREIVSTIASLIKIDDISCFEYIEFLYNAHKGGYGNEIWRGYRPMLNPCGFWCGNFSVPVKFYEDVNGFSSDYKCKYGGEEPDFVERCLKAGAWASWVEGSFGYHLAHPRKVYSIKALGIQKYRKDRGMI